MTSTEVSKLCPSRNLLTLSMHEGLCLKEFKQSFLNLFIYSIYHVLLRFIHILRNMCILRNTYK